MNRTKTKVARSNRLPLIGALAGILVDFFIILLLEAIAYASDCPPGGFSDCANAATVARHPATPIIGGVAGWLVGRMVYGPSSHGQPLAGSGQDTTTGDERTQSKPPYVPQDASVEESPQAFKPSVLPFEPDDALVESFVPDDKPGTRNMATNVPDSLPETAQESSAQPDTLPEQASDELPGLNGSGDLPELPIDVSDLPPINVAPDDLPEQPPIIDPWEGKPLTRWEPGRFGPGEDGNPGGPGMVWWGGNWVRPEDAREAIAASLAADQRRTAESAEFASLSEQRSAEWLSNREQQLQQEVAEEAEREKLERLYWDHADAAAGRSGQAMQLVDRYHDQIFKPDGTIDRNALEQLLGDLRSSHRAHQSVSDGIYERVDQSYETAINTLVGMRSAGQMAGAMIGGALMAPLSFGGQMLGQAAIGAAYGGCNAWSDAPPGTATVSNILGGAAWGAGESALWHAGMAAGGAALRGIGNLASEYNPSFLGREIFPRSAVPPPIGSAEPPVSGQPPAGEPPAGDLPPIRLPERPPVKAPPDDWPSGSIGEGNIGGGDPWAQWRTPNRLPPEMRNPGRQVDPNDCVQNCVEAVHPTMPAGQIDWNTAGFRNGPGGGIHPSAMRQALNACALQPRPLTQFVGDLHGVPVTEIGERTAQVLRDFPNTKVIALVRQPGGGGFNMAPDHAVVIYGSRLDTNGNLLLRVYDPSRGNLWIPPRNLNWDTSQSFLVRPPSPPGTVLQGTPGWMWR